MASMEAATRAARTRIRVDPVLVAVGATIVVAAGLRFATIGDQSYWYDEALTVTIVNSSFGDMLASMHRPNQAEPPLYFVLAWGWSRVFGSHEAGLRSLSALFGVATVPIAYLAGRTLAGVRAGVALAALVAVSPIMIWYSQEARAYSLLVLLCALSFLFFARALRSGRGWDLAAWAVASGLAFVAHYFAVIGITAEAVWLLVRARDRRRTALSVAGLALFGCALLPLALYQRSHGGIGWVGTTPLGQRLGETVRVLETGTTATLALTGWLGVVGLASIAGYALWRGEPRARRGALVALTVGVSVIAVPVLMALAGSDYVLARYLLPAWIPLALVVAIGLTMAPMRRLGMALIVAICALFLQYDVKLATWDELERDDWKGLARTLGPVAQDRLVVVAPGWQALPLAVYRPRLRRAPTPTRVREVDLVRFDFPGFNRGGPPQPSPGPPFRMVQRATVQRMTLLRFRAPVPSIVVPRTLTTRGENGSLVLVERGE